MKNLQKEIALEIDKDRLRVFVAAFRSATSQGLFARTNVNIARPIFFRPQTFDRQQRVLARYRYNLPAPILQA